MSIATVHEIARIAGVSKSTVSRVINQSSKVAPEMAQSVRDAMSRLGYQPSPRRPGPKTAGRAGVRTGNLLLLFVGQRISSGHQLPGSPELLRGIEMAVDESGMKLMWAGVDGEGSLPAALGPREIDGAILFGKHDAITPMVAARLERLPVVALIRGFDGLRVPVDEVGYDNSVVGQMAAQYLIGRGHKQVGFFRTFPAHAPFIARQRDFTSAASSAGAEVTSLVGEDAALDRGQELRVTSALVDRMLAAPQRPTGLFVVADHQVPPLYHVLEDRGIVPGRDIDVISCDNSPYHFDQLRPRPATIDINLELVGSRAVQQLMWRIANPNVKNRINFVVKPMLVPGEASSFDREG